MKKATYDAYDKFLERLIYSIDHVDWKEERAAKMTKLLLSLDNQFPKWTDDVLKYQKQVHEAIDLFERGKISDFELMEKIRDIKNKVR